MFLNILGYYGVFIGMELNNDHRKLRQFDADQYTLSETVTIKIPLTIPYAADSDEFERVDGQFEHEGQYYRMIKQKLCRDTLHIVCVQDVEHKRIQDALSDYVKTFTDKSSSGQRNAKLAISLVKEYLIGQFQIGNTASGWSIEINRQGKSEALSEVNLSLAVPPPRQV